MNRKLEVIKAKNGEDTVKVDNILIHSMYNPSREAENFAKNSILKVNKKNKVVVIYGLGLGYHVKILLDNLDNDYIVALFDADEEFYEKTKAFGVVSEVLKDKRVKFYNSYDNKLLFNLSKYLNEVNDIIIFKPALKILPDKYLDLKRILNGYELARIEIEKHGAMAEKNAELNLKETFKKIKDFINEYDFNGKTIVLVASGPSLDLRLENLRNIREKIVVFSVGSAANTLIQGGIVPDMVSIIDPQDIVFSQLKQIYEKNIPLCFLSTANNLTVSKWIGSKYIFFNNEESSNEYQDICIETGKSVATAALSIAIECKPDKIVFMGQDLAYINNKSHCDDHGSNLNSGFDYVKGVSGEKLLTNEGFLYFKAWIENKIRKTRGIQFINCSMGADIEGTKICSYIPL